MKLQKPSGRILIAGAGGGIGTALCQHLRTCGMETVALRRDRNDRYALQEATAKNSLVCCAGIAHRKASIEAYQRSNIATPLCLARQASRVGVKRLIFLSSIKAVGISAEQAGLETPPRRIDPYSWSKRRAELLLEQHCRANGLELVVLRPALVCSPQVRGNLRLLLQGLTWGLPLPLLPRQAPKPLIGIDNLVSAIHYCLICDSRLIQESPFILYDEPPLSLAQLYEELSRQLRRRPQVLPLPDGLATWLTHLPAGLIQGLSPLLQQPPPPRIAPPGWQPPLGLAQGLERMVEGFRQTG
ncbi:NAD-dependent epimerase/dehydratase family protein [Desulfuromonas thiophila]|uniref:UDP-glucose 4-epimerase n=1 Tax=Desulfuromonas thiophila TaxID=57664 RepID=A0A1G7EW55_9BACT|nr:NAD-dependent epimerase/dehydratase family protein [Desulfuromonas thiophila]SDE67842.1 UDP-glucose 4-epimerase [Desulfuromonas thiophila]